MINNVIIMGRMVATPEPRITANGTSVTSFDVAVDRRFNKQGEERQADFLSVVAWGKTCDFICKFFSKGQIIAIQGYIQTRMYEDKNGNKRKITEIVADNVSFCGGKNESNAGSIDVPPPPDAEYRDIPETDEELPL